LLFGLALSLLLSASGGFFSLPLGHFLRPLCNLLLGTHLLFSGTAGLLLSTLHFGLLLTTCGFFRLALRHLLCAALRFLLSTHLLLFSGTACLLLGLALGPLFGGMACDFLLLVPHGSGFSLLPDAIGFRGRCLFGGQAFSRGTLLLGCHLLLLLHDGSFGLLACFFSFGGGLPGRHALLLGGQRLLLLSSSCGLHAAFFRFGIRCSLFSGPFLCHGMLLQFQLLALLHCGGMGLFPGSMHVSSFSFGGCSGGHLFGRHFFSCHLLL
jgi:hypothetical protein